ncbi:MAG: hypothetical protein KVP17_004485 [Porospora cf. gigantea B]|uniref:uncharacterized protein n=1 Tax=Porospora cf. gigantea B TaxID=2853592 RepID=UPI003571ED01|nr:MAG: hypothetical protein KVP17_004485 [Porospora cf. gigantea B]
MSDHDETSSVDIEAPVADTSEEAELPASAPRRSSELQHDGRELRVKSTTWLCTKSLVKQVVFAASIGSFMFGFNLALLNTSLSSIGTELWPCSGADLDIPSGCAPYLGDLTVCYPSGACRVDGSKVCDPPAPLDCSDARWLNTLTTTAVFLGAAFGAILAGRQLFRGRRKLMLQANVLFLFTTVCMCVSNSFAALVWARLMAGVGVGVISAVVPTYMAEMTPHDRRGKYGVSHQLMVTVGIFVAVLLGLPLPASEYSTLSVSGSDVLAVVNPSTFSKVWWRVMLGLNVVPVLLSLLFFVKVFKFETPMWYMEKGNAVAARAVLDVTVGVEEVDNEFEELNEGIKQQSKHKVPTMELFSERHHRIVLAVGLGIAAFQQFTGINVFVASSNVVFGQAGVSDQTATSMSVIMSALNVVMTLPAMYLIEKLGRRTLLLIGVAGQIVGVLPAMILLWAFPDGNATQWLQIVGVFVFIVFFAVGYGPVLWVYLFEIFPVEIRDKAIGLAVSVNWIAGICMVFLGNALSDNRITYTLFVSLNSLALLLIFLFVKETKNRRLTDSPYAVKAGDGQVGLPLLEVEEVE